MASGVRPPGLVGSARSAVRATRRASPISGSSANRGLLGEDEVGAHAAEGEVPHAVGVLGPVRVRVEVPHALPARVLEQLDRVEGVPDALAPEAEVLVELADALALRSMWKSFPCQRHWATPWWNDRPDMVSSANSGLRPTIWATRAVR